MRSKADETLVIVETLICPLQISQLSFCIVFLGLVICGWFDAYISKQSNLHYACAITPKCITSGGARLRCLTFEKTSQRW